MESTHGDRDHRTLKETAIETPEVLKKAVDAGAKILVPVFAVGRTQLLLYLLAGAFKRGTLPVDCLARHAGPSARQEIRCTHPDRTNCLQCHALP